MTGDFQTPYPGYDVLDAWDTPSWNDQTRRVFAERIGNVPERRFFTEHEWATLQAVCDRIMPQPERRDPVAIVPWIDQALFEDRTDGTRYADLPPMQQAWRTGLAAIDGEAELIYGGTFCALGPDQQDGILHAIDQSEADPDLWSGLAPRRFFRHLLLKQVVAIYYTQPAGMSEIGFGGPASPRGYVRLASDRRDPWEAPLSRRPDGGRGKR